MPKTIEGGARLGALLGMLALSVQVPAGAEQMDAGQHAHGVGRLSVVAEGPDVAVELAIPVFSALGFERRPETESERELLRLATENLNTGDGLVRFNTQAGCQLEASDVNTGFGMDAVPASSEAHRDMFASYRFVCARPDRLRSAAVGLFVGFPALERVHVEYVLQEGRGVAELARNRPVVSFVPLQ